MAKEPSVLETHMFARNLQENGQNPIAIEVFQTNARRHPNAWPTQLGLARAYATSGNKQKALEHGKLALKQAPNEPARKNVEAVMRQWESTAAKK